MLGETRTESVRVMDPGRDYHYRVQVSARYFSSEYSLLCNIGCLNNR